MLSVYFGDRVTTQLLIDAGANLERTEKNGRTAIDLARKDKIKKIVKRSLSSHNMVSPRDEDRYRSDSIISPRSEFELYNGHTRDSPENLSSPSIYGDSKSELDYGDMNNVKSPFKIEKSSRIGVRKKSSMSKIVIPFPDEYMC
jgi:hypothetical protein